MSLHESIYPSLFPIFDDVIDFLMAELCECINYSDISHLSDVLCANISQSLACILILVQVSFAIYNVLYLFLNFLPACFSISPLSPSK